MALAENGFLDLPFVDLGRAPYVWKKMILVARRPAGGVKRRIKILGLKRVPYRARRLRKSL
jgi:hypothetical protein